MHCVLVCVSVPQTSVQQYTGPVQRCEQLRTTEQSAAVHGTLDWHWKGTKYKYLELLGQLHFSHSSVPMCVFVILTPAPRRMPSGCRGVRGTKTGLS